ncbi:hypothetical protein M2459_003220 [Parabacteroides sp. PF5-5]|uniref:DUF3575 domain-containing protein n=1 Tax=unclassified Parabacteroides TaxID=2649774 RepID=UPI002476456A|nr:MULTISPECIES: DUF3575 domain-containing protein [unclassified Parabacteroides]MDH6306524.1 hypothetical protein [Parabacteroides sp. PH5-39]MDH6317491.1 hypothetical protein [Parabacteroides sp. PF5-13]MDH6321206.1 hypothetical protein [Parabacteroides sp. PH5-13]MDH6324938.1 hypothetical protein [Parabacteroides sp. PH5-8]MDH6328647.1 hypothetical protein [Parabacteroides sp. PH5-41]
MLESKLRILIIVFISFGSINIYAYFDNEENSKESKVLIVSDIPREHERSRVCVNNYLNKSKRSKQEKLLSGIYNSAEDTSADYYFIPKVLVKTNLVYLAGLLPDFSHYTPIPNLEAEWFITSCWSVTGTGAYAKWGTGKGREFGISSWSIEPRFWFEGFDFIDGFYTGIYGMAGDFDKKGYGNDPIYNNRTGDFWGGGLSLGGLVLFHENWGLEVGLRVGVRRTETDLYCDQEPNYYKDQRYTKTNLNLQGLKVALVYRFGIKINK